MSDEQNVIPNVIPTEAEGRAEESLKPDQCSNCESLKTQAEEYKAGWQRALADYRNLQKEVASMRSQWAQMSEQRILEEFIPVYDHLKLAINNEQMASDKSPWLEGVRHVARQFDGILKAHNAEEIKTVGEKFDPQLHEAVIEEESEGKAAGIILKEVEGGYKMGDRVIKPAKVIISK